MTRDLYKREKMEISKPEKRHEGNLNVHLALYGKGTPSQSKIVRRKVFSVRRLSGQRVQTAIAGKQASNVSINNDPSLGNHQEEYCDWAE